VRFSDQEPPRGRKAKNWQYEPVEKGGGFNAWIAAKPIWLNCHFIYRSIPCYWYLTGGKLDCPYCISHPNLNNQGYLPLYRDTYREVFVIVGENLKTQLQSLPVFGPVFVWREKSKGSGVAIRPSDWAKKWKPPTDQYTAPNICPSLLTVWKEQKLKDWFAENDGYQGTTPTETVPLRTAGEPPPSSSGVGDSSDPINAKLRELQAENDARRAREVAELEALGLPSMTKVMAGRAGILPTPSTNGKHVAGKGGAK
jgi:hypothetical protein